MKSVRFSLVEVPAKAPTGVAGFDEITGGGLPRGRTTLLVGGPGSGKTILALQFLVHGARRIAFDALDTVLALLPDPAARGREICRLHEWLAGHTCPGR